MPQEHDWVLDLNTTRDMNLKCCGNPFGLRFSVERCSKCACIRIADGEKIFSGRMYVYKPAQWTWNPFKTLKEKPPCPAHW